MKNRSKLLVLLTALFLLVLSIGLLSACGNNDTPNTPSSEAEDPKCPPPPPYKLSFNLLKDGTWSVSRGEAMDINIVIPEVYDDKKVTEIKTGGFSDFIELETISIPKTVKKIKANALNNCQNLKQITLQSGLEEIGTKAFKDCKNLPSINIPDSVRVIGDSAFSGCSNLSSITLPFVGGTQIEELEYPEELKASASTLFGYIFGTVKYDGSKETTQYYNDNSSAVYYIPEKLEQVTVRGGYLLYGAFYNCSNIKTLTLSNVGIMEKSLYGVDNVETASIPLRAIPYLYKGKLKKLTVSGTGNIHQEAFSECESLENVTIGYGVVEIGEDAFSLCQNLKSVTILDSVTKIGDRAFGACPQLKNVQLGKNLVVIGDEAFGFCGIESITIPAKVASIGHNAFSNCFYLKEVALGSGLKSIGYQAFYNCEKLSNVFFSEVSRWEAINMDDTSYRISLDGLSNSAQVAIYLKNTYCNYNWTRS